MTAPAGATITNNGLNFINGANETAVVADQRQRALSVLHVGDLHRRRAQRRRHLVPRLDLRSGGRFDLLMTENGAAHARRPGFAPFSLNPLQGADHEDALPDPERGPAGHQRADRAGARLRSNRSRPQAGGSG